MTLSPTGFFEIATSGGIGLADANANDLVLFTSNPSQRILLGCGENTVSAVSIAPEGVQFNTALNMTRLSISNLTVSDTVSVKNVTSVASSMNLQSFYGPLNLKGTGYLSVDTTNPSSASGAFQVMVSGSEKMRVAANGFVGINTPNPASTLDVAGDLAINGVKTLSAARDLVNVKSLSVNGDVTLGSGDFKLNSTSKSLTLDRLYDTNLSGPLTVGGRVSLNSLVTINSGVFAVNNSNLCVRADSTLNVGVKTYNPRASLDVVGSIMSSVGTLGPVINLLPPSIQCTDVPTQNGKLILDKSIENGNPSVSTNFFDGAALLNPTFDFSGEEISWNRFRFIFRGCLLAESTVGSCKMQIHRYNSGSYTNATPGGSFTVPNNGQSKGYQYVVTPWVAFTQKDEHYAIVCDMPSVMTTYPKYRFGAVHMQFASSV